MNRALWFFAALLSSATLVLAQQPATTAPHDAHASAQPAPSAEKVWADLMEGNQRFVAGKTRAYNVVSLRQKLASGQQPNVIVLSCSDSRVSPELVFDQNLGDLFVVRTAGNVADPVGLGSVEYAVDPSALIFHTNAFDPAAPKRVPSVTGKSVEVVVPATKADPSGPTATPAAELYPLAPGSR